MEPPRAARAPPPTAVPRAHLRSQAASRGGEARHGVAPRVASRSSPSGLRYVLPKSSTEESPSHDSLARSPSDSVASPGSQASSGSYRSAVASVHSSASSSSPQMHGKSDGKPSPATPQTDSKKRPLSAYNGQPQRPPTKQKCGTYGRASSIGGDDDGQRLGRCSGSPPPRAATARQLSRVHQTDDSPGPLSRSNAANGRSKQLTTRMAEHLFRHSTALLHHGNLDHETRTAELLDEVRRVRDEQATYERKLRSLRRELETLDPLAAAAHARGESVGLDPETRQRVSQPPPQTSSVEPRQDAGNMLVPPQVPAREAAMRTAFASRNTQVASFSDALRGLDQYAQNERSASRGLDY